MHFELQMALVFSPKGDFVIGVLGRLNRLVNRAWNHVSQRGFERGIGG